MDQAKKATKEVADGGVNFDRLGSKMQDVGMGMSKYVTLPLIAVGGAAVKMSSDFEGAFGRMVGLAGVSADEVDGLKKSVLDLAGETAQAPQDLADGLYFLRSSGLSAADAMDALKVSAKASAAGLGSTAVIADAVSSAMNAYAKSGLSAAEATDILTGTARAGKAEPAELASALGRVLPISSELGVSFKDVGGAIASLSLTGNDASTSATLLTNILSKMLKPSQQGAEALAGVGMSATSIRESIADKGLLGTLDDLKLRLGDAGFVKFLEDAQAVQGALSLTGQNAEHVHTVFDQVANSAGATDAAFAAMADTSGFKMKQAWADVQVALIQAGDVILPIVSGIAGAIGHLAETFTNLPGPVQAIVVAFLGLVAAAGPLLMIGGSLVKNYNQLSTALGTMHGKMLNAEGGMTNLSKGMVYAMTGLAALAIGMYAVADHAANLAERLAFVKETAMDLSRATDAGIKEVLSSMSFQILAAKDLDGTMKNLAQTNLEGAKRALELGAANGLSEKQTIALRQAIINEDAAVAQAAVSADTYKSSTDEAADAQAKAEITAAGYTSAVTALIEAVQKAEQAEKANRDAIAAGIQAQRDMNQARIDGLSGIGDLDQSLRDLDTGYYNLQQQLIENVKTQKDHTLAQGEKDQSNRDLLTSEHNLAEKVAETAAKYAEESGAVDGTKRKTDLMVDSLLWSKAQYPALAAEIQKYIDKLLGIPKSVDTVIRHTGTGLDYAAAGTPPGGSLGGLTWVGEDGPELLDLRRGDVVHSHFDSMQMMVSATSMVGLGGGQTVVNNYYDSTSATLNNNHQPVTIDDFNNLLAFARMS